MENVKVSAARKVILHAAAKRKRGRNPSLAYKGERNPRKALALALSDYEWEKKIPEISDKILAQRMKQIKYVKPAMQGINGKIYTTSEEDEKYFDLFYVKNHCNPRTQAFNFEEGSELTTRAVGLKPLATRDIFVRIGGYYGFCKISFAELMAQIPADILPDTVAFALNPKGSPRVLNSDYQSTSIIFYGKNGEGSGLEDAYPSVQGLIKPVDLERANRLKEQIKPIINFYKEGYYFIAPGEIEKLFMRIGIWIALNGSHLHYKNETTPVPKPYKLGAEINVYQEFGEMADFYEPNYAYLISQIPDELINEKTIGFLYRTTDYFRTKEGTLHVTKLQMVEKE